MFHYILCLFIIPIIICEIFYYEEKENRLKNIAITMYFSVMLLNVLFYSVSGKSLLNITFDITFYMLYIIGNLLFCSFSYQIMQYKTSYQILILKVPTLLFGVVFTTFLIYFYWLLGESGRMSFEMFMYNLSNPVNSDTANFALQIGSMLLFIILMNACLLYSIFACKYLHFLKFKQWLQRSKKEKIQVIVLPMICLFISGILPFYTFHFEDAYSYFFSESKFIEEHYVHPNDVQLSWPSQKRNLIYIFVESFESSSFSKELGGLNELNLLPNLTSLMKEGTHFSNKEDGFGGALTMPQASVTISGMASALGGINYKMPTGPSSIGEISTLPGVITLLDLLKEQGYQEYFTIGTYVDDYSIGPFYRKHGNAKTIGLNERIELGDLPSDYKVWWGFEDSKLYTFAKKDLNTLANSQEPFMYTMTTNDTHRVGGYLDSSCSMKYEYSMQNAIACTDQMLSEFLKWVMSQPFYENTTVVVVGDHLGHEEDYVASLHPQEDRRIFNLILNSVQSLDKNEPRQFWAGDMFPTVLSSMGVEIEDNRLGLGTDLFSNTPTLIETYGSDFITKSLGENSQFYNQHFLK